MLNILVKEFIYSYSYFYGYMGGNIIQKRILTLLILFLFIFSSLIPMISAYELLTTESHCFDTQFDFELPNIMLTGYWNPTGQMIAPFSNNTFLNPDGWKGANWENRGYNIYSFFPTPGIYNGTFEVDYQDTWDDFWSITYQVKPIAIISFGAGGGPWEIEFNARNLNKWIGDNKIPYQPTPCPPDNSVPAGYIRHSTLPVQKIKDAVNELTTVETKVDWMGNPGAYLCEYMAYLGMWYQSIHHNDKSYPCKAAGFIHVKASLTVEEAMKATNVTIRETIKYLEGLENPPDIPIITGPNNGKIETEYEYTFKAADPNGYDVKYFIDWGDGNLEWTDYNVSNENVYVNHTWNKKGTYNIMAMAMNINGSISRWGTLEVTMPRNGISNVQVQCYLEQFQKAFSLLKQILKFII